MDTFVFDKFDPSFDQAQTLVEFHTNAFRSLAQTY